MNKHFHQLLLAATVSILNFETIEAKQAQAATLKLGGKANIEFNFGFYFNPLQDKLNLILLTNTISQGLLAAEQIDKRLIETSPSAKQIDKELIKSLPSTEQINQNFKERYQGVIEEELQTVSALKSNQLLNSQGLIELQPQYAKKPDNAVTNQTSTQNNLTSQESPQNSISLYLYLSLIPLLGIGGFLFFFKGGILDKFFSKYQKKEVSESAIVLHDQELKKAKSIASQLQILDHTKFSGQEFLLFVKAKFMMAKGLDEYQGLHKSIRLLQVAIKTKNSFLRIEQTELRYRGFKQQELYNFVAQLLSQNLDKLAFRTQVQRQLNQLLPQVKTEEGKIALQAYAKELDRLSENELGLQLLCLFKQYQLADYSVLKTISDMIESLGAKDLQDFNELVALVMIYQDIFMQLRHIIGVSEKQNIPDTYAKMIQYIALSDRHEASYKKFQELIALIKKWQKHYQGIIRVREVYSSDEYQQPKTFSEQIPGLDIYQKYKNLLTDKKTGYTYVDFGETNH